MSVAISGQGRGGAEALQLQNVVYAVFCLCDSVVFCISVITVSFGEASVLLPKAVGTASGVRRHRGQRITRWPWRSSLHAATPRFPFPARGRGRKGRGRTHSTRSRRVAATTSIVCRIAPPKSYGGNPSKNKSRRSEATTARRRISGCHAKSWMFGVTIARRRPAPAGGKGP
jgi:hypothetical protein